MCIVSYSAQFGMEPDIIVVFYNNVPHYKIRRLKEPGIVCGRGRGLRVAFLVLIIAICLYGVIDSIRLAWMCDDAFISFRYAKNLVNGLGLVYNAGEYVDGYTNFLWTMLFALGLKFGIDPVKLSQVLGIASYALTVLMFLLLTRWIARKDGGAYIYFPLTALALSLHHDQHVYATSGLETSFFVLLISIGFWATLAARGRASFFLAGLILTLSILTRPEGLLFYVAAFVYLMMVSRERRANILFYLLPLVLIYLPYWIWHLWYYGYPFPNTYYAKSAHLPYYIQGFRYLILYFKTYYVLLAVPFFLIACTVAFARRSRSRFFRDAVCPDTASRRAILLAVLFAAPFLLYVLRVGGDFMFARFLLTATPFLFLILECTVNELFAGRTRVAVMVILTVLTFARWNQFDRIHRKDIDGITYEPFFYPPGIVEETREMGERMQEYFRDMPIVVGYFRCMLVYYADFPVALEIATGLTDRHIAHQPIDERARPGHEKSAPEDYLRERRMNFTFCSVLDTVPYLSNYDIMSVRGMGGSIFIYDNEIMEKLRKQKDIQFVHFPSYLDNYIRQMDQMPREKVLADYHEFRRYYFDYNDDHERERVFKEILHIETGNTI